MKRCQTCNILGGDNQLTCYADGQRLAADPLATALQQAIGEKYALTKLIGKGAMGAVYGAHHRDLGDVAIKVMLAPGDNQTLSERFLREARALRKLRHQNAVLIYDLERSPTGVTYMVMEMVAGRSLGQDLRERKRLTLDETMEVAEAVCSALAAAHERGIIHRDLKPDNILRAEENGLDGRMIRTIKLVDFGIVKLQGTGDDEASLKLTKVGRPIGTPFYMSPEQWFGDGPGITALDHRTDIYALGCTLYEMLSGRPPFVGRTTAEMRRQHLHDEAVPLYQVASQVPVPVSRVIMRALAKDRDERQQSATELLDELRAAYDENFQHTDRKMEERLRSTQEALVDEANAAERPGSLTDTEESVPMFLDQVVAIDPALLSLPQEHEATNDLPPPLAVEDETALQQPLPASSIAEQPPASVSEQLPSDSLTPGRDDQVLEVPAVTPTGARAHSRRRRVLIVATALLLLGTVVAAAVGLYLYYNRRRPLISIGVLPPLSQFKTPTIPMSALTGTLRLSAAPGSEVFVDDEKAGVAGTDGLFTTQLPVGLRNVRVAAKNYRVWQRDVRVTANQKATLNAAREPFLKVEEATTDQRKERAQAAFEKKDYDAAEAEYREVLKDADDGPAHARLGFILNTQQRYAEATEELEAAARLDAKDTEARAALVRLYLLKSRDDEAETTARQLVKLTPRDPSAHHLLARALLRDPNNLDEALREIEEALKSKETPELLETRAYILLARNSLDEALATAKHAVELDRGKNPAANAAVAVILFRMERVSEAVSTYRQLRQSDRNDRWGDLKRLELQRGYSKPTLDTLAALIARTN